MKYFRPRCSTPATVGLTPNPVLAEPDFIKEARDKVVAHLEEGRVVRVEDVQSWLREARNTEKARPVLNKRTREQVMAIIEAVVGDGLTNAKIEKSAVWGAVRAMGDGSLSTLCLR